MSRLGKKPLPIPEKVKAEIKGNILEVSGPLGKLTLNIDKRFNIKIENNSLTVMSLESTVESNKFHGLIRGLIKNMIEGVLTGFKKDLELVGLGYKANVEGKHITMTLGLSHPVKCEIPEGLKVAIEKQTLVSVSGVDKAAVGNFAAILRDHRKPEPYKGTGIRYAGEHIIRKAGKSAAGASGGGAAAGGAKK
ncbi:50S ribosomal protein L6 [Elusimicrobiota bacterium]